MSKVLEGIELTKSYKRFAAEVSKTKDLYLWLISWIRLEKRTKCLEDVSSQTKKKNFFISYFFNVFL